MLNRVRVPGVIDRVRERGSRLLDHQLIDCVSDLPTAAAKNPTALESNWAAAVSQLIFNMSVTSLRVYQVTSGKWLASLWRA